MKPVALLASLALAVGTVQAFVPPRRNIETIVSERFPGANITYKKVENLCETTEGVASYSGYVHLPREFIPDAGGWPEGSSGNYFFWYFGMMAYAQISIHSRLTNDCQRLGTTPRTLPRPYTSAEARATPRLTAHPSSPAASTVTPTRPSSTNTRGTTMSTCSTLTSPSVLASLTPASRAAHTVPRTTLSFLSKAKRTFQSSLSSCSQLLSSMAVRLPRPTAQRRRRGRFGGSPKSGLTSTSAELSLQCID